MPKGHTAGPDPRRPPGPPAAAAGCPVVPPPHALPTAGGRRPSPPPRAGLCNPVAAARPRAGPWGEGRGRLGWGREAATRGAACTVDPRAGGRVSRSRVRREARAGGRAAGAGSRPRRGAWRGGGRRPGRRPRPSPRASEGRGDSFRVEAVPEAGWGTQREPGSRVTSFSATGISSPARFAPDSASEAFT